MTEFVGADGSIAAHYEYDPYGNVTVQAGDVAASNPFRFSTKYADDETALLYYGYRFYSLQIGRWLSRDPMDNLTILLPSSSSLITELYGQIPLFSKEGKELKGLNSNETKGISQTYVFCINNPQSYMDPDGQWAILVARTATIGMALSEIAKAGIYAHYYMKCMDGVREFNKKHPCTPDDGRLCNELKQPGRSCRSTA